MKRLRCTTCYLRTSIRAPCNGGPRRHLLKAGLRSACGSGVIFGPPLTSSGLAPSPDRCGSLRNLLSPSSPFGSMNFSLLYAPIPALSTVNSPAFYRISQGFCEFCPCIGAFSLSPGSGAHGRAFRFAFLLRLKARFPRPGRGASRFPHPAQTASQIPRSHRR